MPLLDSFKVDHTRMNAPGMRLAKSMSTKSGDKISVYDLRFCRPNLEIMSERGTHTLEHLFAGFMREHLNSADVEIIDISPMGCRTGFYMSVIGAPSESAVAAAWSASMKDILGVGSQADIPELNKFQCGTFAMHSLAEAKQIAQNVLNKGIGVIKNDEIALDINLIK